LFNIVVIKQEWYKTKEKFMARWSFGN